LPPAGSAGVAGPGRLIKKLKLLLKIRKLNDIIIKRSAVGNLNIVPQLADRLGSGD
jgi:hypothetical protein